MEFDARDYTDALMALEERFGIDADVRIAHQIEVGRVADVIHSVRTLRPDYRGSAFETNRDCRLMQVIKKSISEQSPFGIDIARITRESTYDELPINFVALQCVISDLEEKLGIQFPTAVELGLYADGQGTVDDLFVMTDGLVAQKYAAAHTKMEHHDERYRFSPSRHNKDRHRSHKAGLFAPIGRLDL